MIMEKIIRNRTNLPMNKSEMNMVFINTDMNLVMLETLER